VIRIVTFFLIAGHTGFASASTPASTATSVGRPASAAQACNAVVDEHGVPQSVEVTWIRRVETREREKLDESCETVGPIVLRRPPFMTSASNSSDVAFVGWNIHVGGGDVVTFVQRLRSGAVTGRRVSHYVLMLQEAHRLGGLQSVAKGVRVPKRVAPHVRMRVREDIVSVAQTLNTGLYYVPSMRNGAGPPFEDRGNAILSTLPLEDLQAIELPFTRQPRIAISAVIRGIDRSARPWALRTVAVHLDALAGASRLWIFASGWRARQADALLEALDGHEPAVVGSDLNTWFLGRWEAAYRRIEAVYPDTERTVVPAGSSWHGRLDYMFLRLPTAWRSSTWRPDDPCGMKQDTCDSDHRPILSMLVN
jgi:endonuclease/exonuclease/phosphatase family metal-dependent hydrolase